MHLFAARSTVMFPERMLSVNLMS